MEKRKYLPTLAELIDRMSISQLKEVFIPEHKEEYGQEIRDFSQSIGKKTRYTEKGQNFEINIGNFELFDIGNGYRNTKQRKYIDHNFSLDSY